MDAVSETGPRSGNRPLGRWIGRIAVPERTIQGLDGSAEGGATQRKRGMMSITAHSRAAGDTGAKARLPMLVPSLAALLYPFALKGFNVSVTSIAASAAGAPAVLADTSKNRSCSETVLSSVM